VRARRLYLDSDLAGRHGISSARDNHSAVNILSISTETMFVDVRANSIFESYSWLHRGHGKKSRWIVVRKVFEVSQTAYCCIVFHLLLASVNLSKALVTSEGYHVVSLAILI